MLYNFDELTFNILTINHFIHEPGTFNVQPRPFAALTLRTAGSGEFEIETARFTSNPGDILFIPENTPYKVKYSASESIVIHLSDCNYTSAETVLSDRSGFFHVKFTELLNYWQDFYNINGAKSMIYNILQRISESGSAYLNDRIFFKCISYIDENFSNPNLNIPKICTECFISESSLRRKFHSHYNMSAKQYILKLRLNKAIELLTSGGYSVKAVSEMCGFSDEKYFSRSIKNRYGRPPSAFLSNFL